MTPKALFEHALAELDRMLSLSREEQVAWMRSVKTIIPPTVPAPKGGSLLISEDGARSLGQLSTCLRKNSSGSTPSVSPQRHHASVEHAFGRVVASIAEGSAGDDLYALFLSELQKTLVTILRDSEYFLPCHLFVIPNDHRPPEITVGPVRFLSRSAFLDTVRGRGPGSEALVLHLNADKTHLPAGQRLGAEGLQKALSDCAWVASVAIRQTDQETGIERATTCARLGLAILRLILGRFDAQQVRLETDAHLPQLRHHLSAPLGGEIQVGWTRRVDGLPTKVDSLTSWARDTAVVRRTMGDRLFGLVDPGAPGHFPQINAAWLTALYWFARGCNETSDVDAVVAFGACLDTITGSGGSEASVRSGLAALLRKKPADRVTTGGLSLAEVVERLYRRGRSQFIHGGRSPYFAELEGDRSLGGRFCQYALWAASEAISRYATTTAKPDEYKYVLKAFGSKSQSP